MTRYIKIILIICAVSVLLCNSAPAFAKSKRAKYLFKVASLAPEGSVWAKRFTEFTEEVIDKSDGAIGFKIYPGGVMGDDRAMYRKMKIGQLHGGGFTMTGIGAVVPDFRVLGIPFLFQSYAEVDHVINGIWSNFQKAFEEKNLVLLAISEVGFIYTMSTEPITSVEELKKTKTWVPEGDPISQQFLKNVGVTATSLSIPDVLTSLQTGLLDTVFNSYYGSIVLQWFTKTKYITDVPFAYGYGAFVLDKKTFSRLPDNLAALMKESALKHFSRLLLDTRKSNEEALQVLKDNRIELLPASPETQNQLQAQREKTIVEMTGEAFSKDIYDKTLSLLNEVRNK